MTPKELAQALTIDALVRFGFHGQTDTGKWYIDRVMNSESDPVTVADYAFKLRGLLV